MPTGLHQVDLNVPIEEVWKFVSVMDQWAPLVPGYIEHQILSDLESTWTFISDLGLVKKKISLMVKISSINAPTKVKFDLTGINENFSGNGYFEAKNVDGDKTLMTGCLDIQAQGIMAKMVNGILKTYVPQLTMELSEAVGEKLREITKART
ncbi:CoxG family protein [Bacillus massilinigeriensis]|uniref:CoxG family protein n=1 Tax=Bacillus massilionigeriensis TaxID=1805475 RepID=UPI00096B148D|nr:SRPBCC family protein [Bacillus massilionigeriensis]